MSLSGQTPVGPAGAKLVIEKMLGQCVGLPGPANVTRYFRVFSPSTRLTCLIAVVYKPGNPQEVTLTGPTWRLQGRQRMTQGDSLPLQYLFTESAAPDAYELADALEEVRGYVSTHTTDTGFPATSAGGGQWFVQATWEPNVPIGAEELQQLFSMCSVSIEWSPTDFNGSASL
ncbi:MAG: hypothetical protein JO156_07090 [Solirubrobacterales bacterium]|nr:hypothetical protein [Solirubrobacterales bacterium]